MWLRGNLHLVIWCVEIRHFFLTSKHISQSDRKYWLTSRWRLLTKWRTYPVTVRRIVCRFKPLWCIIRVGKLEPNVMCDGAFVVQFAVIRAYDVVCMLVTYDDIRLKPILWILKCPSFDFSKVVCKKKKNITSDSCVFTHNNRTSPRRQCRPWFNC